ncbi:MAG: P44/Msp2 family outer membrane protein [Cyanobacteria bacterium P01_D01_bin.1]
MAHLRSQSTVYLRPVLWVGLIAVMLNLDGLSASANPSDLVDSIHDADASSEISPTGQLSPELLSTASEESETLETVTAENQMAESGVADAKSNLLELSSPDYSASEPDSRLASRDASELLNAEGIAIDTEDLQTLDATVLGVPVAQNEISDTEDTDNTDVEEEVYRQDGPYLTIYGVPIQRRGFAEDSIGRATFDNGGGGGGAIGYRLGDFRFDAELSYFTNPFNELFFFNPGTTEVAPNQPEESPGAFVDGRAVMFNVYYDIPLSKRFRPYVGAGVGFYNGRINDLSPPGFGGFVANSSSPNLAAYQLRAGLNYSPNSRFDLFTGYRFFRGERFEYPIENSDLLLRPNGLKSSSLEAGVRVVF